MNQQISLAAHTTFGAMTATAVLQVRPGSDVVPELPPALKLLDICNPLKWSTYDKSRFANFLSSLLNLIRVISSYLSSLILRP